MVSSIPMNMGYNNNPYVVMPLNKTRDDGMTVECSTPATKFPDEFMNNLDDIKAADAGLLIKTWLNKYANGDVWFATCVDKNSKRYNIQLDNITPLEDNYDFKE